MRTVSARSGVVQCGRTRGGGDMGNQLRGSLGCADWEREPGIDDDDWDPPGTSRIAPYVPEPPPASRARSRGRDGWWTEPKRSRPATPPPAPDPIIAMLLTRDAFRGYFLQDDD